MMSYPFPPALARLVQEQMASGKYATEDDLLIEAVQALAEEAEDIAAVQEAIAAWKAGDDGVPLAEAFQAIRDELNSGAVE